MVSEINDIEELPEGFFPVNLKLIAKYQQQEPIIRYKYKYGTYHKGYSVEVVIFSLIMCKDKIVIPSKLQSYVLNWYHTYILHPGMDKTEDMIIQHCNGLKS